MSLSKIGNQGTQSCGVVHYQAQVARLPERLGDAELGPLLATSPRSTVHRLGDGLIAKFYARSTAYREVRRQLDVSQRVLSTGLCVPWISDRIFRHKDDGRLGVVCERIDGVTPKEMLLLRPARYRRVIRNLAQLHRSVHQQAVVAGFPSQRERINRHIEECVRIPVTHKPAVLSILASLPDGDALCHGDFSWSNTLINDQRQVVIDWTDVGAGNPHCDVARTWVLLHFNAVWAAPLVAIYSKLLSRAYLRSYYGLRIPAQFADWAVVNAALRFRDLSESHFALTRHKLLSFLDKQLAKRGHALRRLPKPARNRYA